MFVFNPYARQVLSGKALVFLLFWLGCLALSGHSWATAKDSFLNPILSGFYPDPSIVRVDDTYYMVNSTFEWFPGMPIHRSKDLVNWELIGHGLHRQDQLTLQEGLGDYKGIFAVTIRHHKGLFYLITTCVECTKGGNFYVTAKNPEGPWSKPVWLDSPGIDPSIMWDDDGKAYYVGHGNLAAKEAWPEQQGVWLQELDTGLGKLVGPRKQLTYGHANNASWTEGPHLYKINGQYLLLVAEGGTGYFHGVTAHHSKSVWGPYVADYVNPVLTHRHLGRDYPIHSIGHADLVQTQKGDWWSVMLGKRYVDGATLLARETFLTPVAFEGETPIFNPGVGKVTLEQKRPDLPWSPVKKAPIRDDFNSPTLALQWNMLRTPQSQWYTLANGNLVLQPRPQKLQALTNPSFMARRIEDHDFTATTALSFSAQKPGQQAGLAIYRNSQSHFTLMKEGSALVITQVRKGVATEIARTAYTDETVVLRAQAHGRKLQFLFGSNEANMKPIGKVLDMAVISFEEAFGFNGPYVGLYATSDHKKVPTARFAWFDYQAL